VTGLIEADTSIVIRTFNEGRHIGRLLECIRNQNYTNHKVVVVDSGSTDDTLKIAERYLVQIVTIPPEDFSFGASLNAGCRAANGRYLVFISAHAFPNTNTWLYRLVEPFDDPRVGMVYGRQRATEVSRLSEERDLHRTFGNKSMILVDEPFGNNANCAIRRDLWEQMPYDETLTGLEDIAWAKVIQRTGYYVYYKADAVIDHVHDEYFHQVVNRFRREGIACRRIFPKTRYSKVHMAYRCALDMMRDAIYGVSAGKPLRKFLQIPLYRIAQHRGTYEGLRWSEPVTDSDRRKLYYPDVNRGVVIRGANQHQLEELDFPSLADHEALVKVAYVGVCSTDLKIVDGSLDYYKTGLGKYPIVPGHEFSGTIAKVGKAVNGVKSGDKVVSECILGCGTCAACLTENPIECRERRELGVLNYNGAYSQFIKLPSRFLLPLPEDTDLAQATLAEPLAVVLQGLRRVPRLVDGTSSHVAVLGAGSIGRLSAQVLSYRGHRVFVFDRVAAKVENLTNMVIKGSTALEGLDVFDVLVETTGNGDVLHRALTESRTGATILLLGLSYGQGSFNFDTVVCFNKTMVGSVGSTRADLFEGVRFLRRLDLTPFLQHIYQLDEYQDAWDVLRQGEVLKVLLKVN